METSSLSLVTVGSVFLSDLALETRSLTSLFPTARSNWSSAHCFQAYRRPVGKTLAVVIYFPLLNESMCDLAVILSHCVSRERTERYEILSVVLRLVLISWSWKRSRWTHRESQNFQHSLCLVSQGITARLKQAWQKVIPDIEKPSEGKLSERINPLAAPVIKLWNVTGKIASQIFSRL